MNLKYKRQTQIKNMSSAGECRHRPVRHDLNLEGTFFCQITLTSLNLDFARTTEKFYPNHPRYHYSRDFEGGDRQQRFNKTLNLATSAISSYYHHDAAPFSDRPLPTRVWHADL